MREGARRMLIVDDDEGIRESLRFLFKEDYVIEEAIDGDAALVRLLADSQPRVMLLDRMMPRRDGVATLMALADAPDVLERTVIIFITARSDPPDPELAELLTRTTIATVAKPFNLDRLEATVGAAWRMLDQRA